MPEWNKTTARVLSRLRKVSLPTEQWQPTERDKAAIDRVWVFVGVEMEGYNKKENWNFVGAALPSNEQRELRKGVRERLLTVFDEEAFFADGKVANGERPRSAFSGISNALLNEDRFNPEGSWRLSKRRG